MYRLQIVSKSLFDENTFILVASKSLLNCCSFLGASTPIGASWKCMYLTGNVGNYDRPMMDQQTDQQTDMWVHREITLQGQRSKTRIPNSCMNHMNDTSLDSSFYDSISEHADMTYFLLVMGHIQGRKWVILRGGICHFMGIFIL